MGEINIRPARTKDLPHIEHLLLAESLPIAGVAQHLENFVVAERENNVVGAIGLEVYGDTALLRSAVVSPAEKGKGIGGTLYHALLRNAARLGVQRLLLLTNTAEVYFARRGFKRIAQSTVTGPITTSVEFSGACPSHAVCMELLL